jgi:coenzyme PQQ precursor peptide PqqA
LGAGVAHKVFIGNPRDVRSDVQTSTMRRPQSLTLNLLIRHWFDIPPHKYVKIILRCSINRPSQADKDFAGELFFPHYFILRGWHSPRSRRRAKMAWKSPKIVEVPVGMEINMYACAARK